MHDSKADPMLGTTYSADPTEAQTMKNVAYTCYYAALLGGRHFRLFEFLNAATGRDRSPDEYMEIGKRIQNLRQYFNAIYKVDMNSSKMHGRAAGNPPLETVHNRGISLKVDEHVRLYRKCWG